MIFGIDFFLLSFFVLCSGTPPVDLRLPFDGLLEVDDIPLASTEASEVAGRADESLAASSPSSGAEYVG